MPLSKWIECNNGNISNVRKGVRGSYKKDAKVWVKLSDEYIKTFGLNDTFKKLIQVQMEKAIAELDYVITDDRKKLNVITRLENKLIALMTSKGENVEVDEVLLHLSKFQSYPIKKDEITVKQYFKLIDIYTKAHATTN
jgi:UDP-N-acetylmuramoylalanine-D-glutamate ligase